MTRTVVNESLETQTSPPMPFSEGDLVNKFGIAPLTVTDCSVETVSFAIGEPRPDDQLSGYQKDCIDELTTMFPLTSELFSIDDQQVTIATPQGLNRFSDDYLKPLGATTMRTKLVERNIDEPETAEGLCGGLAEGVIEIDARRYFHDVIIHSIGALTFPDVTMKVYQHLAQLSQQLRGSDPVMARKLAVELAKNYEIHARPYTAATKKTHGPRLMGVLTEHFDYDLLTYVEANVGKPPRLSQAVKRELVDSPYRIVVDHPEKYPRLKKWMDWEDRTMPGYTHAVLETMNGQSPEVVHDKQVGVSGLHKLLTRRR